MTDVYALMFAWLPAWFQVVFLTFLAVLAIIVIGKIVAFVLDAIPFL